MPVHLILRLRQLLFLLVDCATLVRGGVIWAIPAVMTKTTSINADEDGEEHEKEHCASTGHRITSRTTCVRTSSSLPWPHREKRLFRTIPSTSISNQK